MTIPTLGWVFNRTRYICAKIKAYYGKQRPQTLHLAYMGFILSLIIAESSNFENKHDNDQNCWFLLPKS